MKILTVEDDAVARAVLRQALHRLGHEVVEANDGEAAWNVVQGGGVRVVVSDWTMPRSDGLDFCRRIRGRVGSEYIYFILLTSRDATQENQTAAVDAGVDDFLTKPLDLPGLLHARGGAGTRTDQVVNENPSRAPHIERRTP